MLKQRVISSKVRYLFSPMPKFTEKRLESALLLFVLLAGCLLLFTSLGNVYLWQDEAQTALISKTILKDGVPKGYDGKNFFSQELGAEYGENYIYKWHTWFPFYLLAAFFKIFGISTLTARLPFAIFGIGSLFLLYYFCRSLFEDRKIATMAVIVLLFSVPFLVLSRQCRYYSMSAFFSLSTLYGYHLITAEKRYGPLVFFLSSSLLFHTQYIYLATLYGAVALHVFLFFRSLWRKMLLWTALVLMINSPWIIWLSGMRYGEQYGSSLFSWSSFAFRMTGFLQDIREFAFPPFLLLIPLCIIGYRTFRKQNLLPAPAIGLLSRITIPLFFITSTLIALSLTAPAPFFRYLAPLLPFFAMLVGFLFAWSMQAHPAIGLMLLAVFFSQQPLNKYMHELTHDYDGPIEGIVRYLNEHAKPLDVVAITYGDLPLKFYTNLRVVGGLTGEDLTPAKNADWVIIRRHTICDKDRKVRNYLIRNIDWHSYKKVVLSYPDIPFENRESPKEHLYKTVKNYPPVILLKKHN